MLLEPSKAVGLPAEERVTTAGTFTSCTPGHEALPEEVSEAERELKEIISN